MVIEDPKILRQYNTKLGVFSKYDFQKRSVDMTGLAAYQQKQTVCKISTLAIQILFLHQTPFTTYYT